MSAPAKLNFKIYQGATFAEVLRWESSVKAYIPITTIAKSAPLQVTAPAHAIPIGWRVKFTNIVGMTELNSDIYYQVSDTTIDTLTINSVNSLGYKAYISGGVVEYNKPIDMTGYTARMQIREKISDIDYILELTTENGGITIDNIITKAITINISAIATAALVFNSAVYSLEMVSSGGQVTPFVGGSLTLVKEVTR